MAGRLANRVQLTTDGHKAYLDAAEDAFGADIDYAMLMKMYSETAGPAARYSPAECIDAKKARAEGRPDPKHISTPYAERQNLNCRMGNRRFTRLTNGFSKKPGNHYHMVRLYTVFHNFVRIHKTLRCTRAVAAGLSQILWSMDDIVKLIDAREEAPRARGPYMTKARRAALAAEKSK